jgi:hypothetical protein
MPYLFLFLVTFWQRLVIIKYNEIMLIIKLFISKIMNKNIIFDFIKSQFPIKRIKNHRNKWSNAIIIPEGYLRKNRKYYPTKESLNKAMIASDIIQIVVNVFGCDEKYAEELVISYLTNIRL